LIFKYFAKQKMGRLAGITPDVKDVHSKYIHGATQIDAREHF
jgi:hypothetical protein